MKGPGSRALKIRPFWTIVLSLTLYMPFEETFLNWLPVSDKTYLLLRFAGEIVLYMFLGIAVLRKLARGKSLRKTPIDLPIIAFVMLAIVSIVVNRSPIVSSLVNLRTLVRYLAVYYLIVNINISKRQIAIILMAILFIGLLQGMLSVGQYFSQDFNNLFSLASRKTDVEIAGQTKGTSTLKVGAAVGTFGQLATMASFLLIPLLILFAYAYRKPAQIIPALKYLLSILVVLWGVFTTYKRIALYASPFLLLVTLFFSGRKQRFIIVIGLCMALSIGGVSLLILAGEDFSVSVNALGNVRAESFPVRDFLLQVFTPEYWEKTTKFSRGWFVREVGGFMLSSGKLLGYGPDEQTVRESLAAADPSKFQRLLTFYPGFEDVYWVAMLAYYGIVALSVFLLVLYRLFCTSRQLIKYSLDDEYRLLGIVFCTLVVLTVVYSFVEGVLEFRAFSFYFWLLAGLVVNAHHVRRRQIMNRRVSTIEVISG